ncbi:MAG: hypothetical protein ACYDCL_07385 [Myxococcales bacterium]
MRRDARTGAGVALAGLLLLGGAPPPGNAWDVWTRGTSALQGVDVGARAAGLEEDLPPPTAGIEIAAPFAPRLERAVAAMRRGLRASACRRPDAGEALAVFQLGNAAVTLALLEASRREDFAPLAIDLVHFGRRLGRCGGARVIEYAVGRRLESLGWTLARWAVRWGLWSPDQVRAVQQVLEDGGGLGLPDLSRALDADLAWALAHPGGKGTPEYSRSANERFLRARTAVLHDALRSGDFSAARSAVDAMARDASVRQGVPPGAIEGTLRTLDYLEHLYRDIAASPRALAFAARPEVDGGERASPPESTPPPIDLGHCERLGPGRYRLDRRARGELAAPEALGQAARLVPHFVNGSVEGLALSEIPRGSLVESCGFRNRDLLLSVNGLDLRLPAAALAAMEAVRKAGHADVVLLRAGRRLSLTVEAAR